VDFLRVGGNTFSTHCGLLDGFRLSLQIDLMLNAGDAVVRLRIATTRY